MKSAGLPVFVFRFTVSAVLMAETKHTQKNKAQARFKLLLALHVQLQSEQKPRLETHNC